MIIRNNVESRKNRIKWEESAYQISIGSDESLKSYEGQKIAQIRGKCEKCQKLLFFLYSFLFFKIYNNMKRLKNQALCQESSCKISYKIFKTERVIKVWSSEKAVFIY